MEILSQCAELTSSGIDVVMVTVLKASIGTPGKPGFKMLVTGDGKSYGTVGGGALEHHAQMHAAKIFSSGENDIEDLDLSSIGMECGGSAILTYEYIGARSRFILFGGGHVSRALLPILESLNFNVTIFDNRQGIIDGIPNEQERALVCGDYKDLSPLADLSSNVDFIFIATQGHLHDYDVLKQLLASDHTYRYIGLIGSRRKIAATCKRLKEEGLSVPDYLYGPVGLKIGGDTAAEIAVSVAAEVVSVKCGVDAPHMRTAQ